MPTRILFGCGKLNELGTTPYLPGKKALIVIGASGAMKKHGYLDRVIKLIKNIGLDEEKLADFNIIKEDLRTFAESSFYAMGSLFDITPVKLTLDDVENIYENAYA